MKNLQRVHREAVAYIHRLNQGHDCPRYCRVHAMSLHDLFKGVPRNTLEAVVPRSLHGVLMVFYEAPTTWACHEHIVEALQRLHEHATKY